MAAYKIDWRNWLIGLMTNPTYCTIVGCVGLSTSVATAARKETMVTRPFDCLEYSVKPCRICWPGKSSPYFCVRISGVTDTGASLPVVLGPERIGFGGIGPSLMVGVVARAARRATRGTGRAAKALESDGRLKSGVDRTAAEAAKAGAILRVWGFGEGWAATG